MQNQNGFQRRWRQKKTRGVSPIIATILLVAITVVLAAVLYILISGLTKAPGGTPLGTALAVGSATASAGSTVYTMSINPSSGLTPASLNFELVSSSGAILGTGTSTTVLTSGMQFQFTASGSLSGAGDKLVSIGVGSFSGQVPTPLP
ncbi:MAG TPA: archaellin/type IV pilin N-terminal domain-containing protein [Thermoplasmata archaeon]|nr:archaellin/type IV pilin N-terminal domain-containing protein [Thermoplasmata archaeon]